MKQSIKNLLLTMLVALVSVSTSAYDFEVDGMYYTITSMSDMKCSVVSGDNEYTGDVKIPSTVTYSGRTFSVTDIGWWAFCDCTNLTSVEIPNSVTSIGDGVFQRCTSLTSIEIPNSVTSIGFCAFYSCTSLTSIEIPNSVTSIGDKAFKYCKSLTSIEIPNSVTYIGYEAFRGCEKLEALKIPSSVTYIEYCAVLGSGIKEIEIGKGIKKLPYYRPYYNTLFTCYNSSTTCDSLKKIIIADSNESLAVPTHYAGKGGYYTGGTEFNVLPVLDELYIGRNLTTLNKTSDYSRYISNTHLKKNRVRRLCYDGRKRVRLHWFGGDCIWQEHKQHKYIQHLTRQPYCDIREGGHTSNR